MSGPLGRITPPDFEHVEKYPLTALAPEARPTFIPVVLGVNWYEGFDTPKLGKDGVYRLPKTRLGSVRGGHCFCLQPAPQPDQPGGEQDSLPWWTFYDQGQERACEGFGHSRALSLLYRKTFDAFWLYDDARRIEGTYPSGEGSTNRSTCAALVKWGAHFETGTVVKRERERANQPGVAIKAYRWATTVPEVVAALGYTASVTEIPLLNSWGKAYPEAVRMPLSVLERLLHEEGEADILTEK